jgi:hypothetical protein
MVERTDLTPEVLRDLYLDQRLTEGEIAERYGTYQVQINRLRKRWGIPTVSKAARLDLPPLTPEQHQILIGSLMGDGHMAATSNTSARFNESHSADQEEYLLWKSGILNPYVSSTTATRKTDKDSGTIYHGKAFTTHSCTQLRHYYDLFYPAPDRKRVFPWSLPKEMTPLVLAVWYMDDGGLANKYHPRIAFGLCDLSLERAMRALRKLGLKPTLTGDTSRDMMIGFPGQSDKFFDLIRPHVPPCMNRKLPVESDRREFDRNARKLTPKMVADLYEGGMSLTDISTVHDVGRGTVLRRLRESGIASRPMGRPRKEYTKTARVALSNYTPKEWQTLSDADRDRWVDEVYSILVRSPFPYPEMRDNHARELERTRDLKMHVVDGWLRPWSSVGCNLCSPFFPNRYKAQWKGARSAFEAWHLEKTLRWAIRFQLDQGDPVLPHRVLRAVTMQHRTPSVFRPTVARWIYQTYCHVGGRVWDPCSGYGGRLLGAHLAGVGYTGTDVDPETVKGNRELAAFLGSTAQVVQCPAERFTPPDALDLVFTSPPYFDRERYSQEAAQSWKQHGSDLDEWLEGFLVPVIRSARDALKSGCPLILNVADLKERKSVIPLVDGVMRMAVREGFSYDHTVQMPLAKLNRGDASEPMLVFRKPSR